MDTGPDNDRIISGDRQAFARLVTRYQVPLFGFLGRMGLDQARAEDIAQETFLRAWQHAARYQADRATFATWLFTIARNLALNDLARAGRRLETAYDEAIPALSGDQPLADETICRQQRRRRLRASLRKLPLSDRSLVALVYVQELTHAAIATIEGCSSGAIKTRLHRAKQRLRILMEDHDE